MIWFSVGVPAGLKKPGAMWFAMIPPVTSSGTRTGPRLTATTVAKTIATTNAAKQSGTRPRATDIDRPDVRALEKENGALEPPLGCRSLISYRFLLEGVRMQCGRDLANGPRIPNAWR